METADSPSLSPFADRTLLPIQSQVVSNRQAVRYCNVVQEPPVVKSNLSIYDALLVEVEYSTFLEVFISYFFK